MTRRAFASRVSAALTCALPAFATPIPVVFDLDGIPVKWPLGRPTAILFVSSICPISNQYQVRIRELRADAGTLGIHLALVNPNQNETDIAVRKHAVAHDLMPIWRDRYGALARHWHVELTPTAILIDSGGKVVYRGAIDDSANPARVKIPALRNAIRQMTAGETVTQPNLRGLGCYLKLD